MPNQNSFIASILRGHVSRAKNFLEWKLLFPFGLFAALLWIFLEIAEDVYESHTQQLDRLLVLALRNPLDPLQPIGPAWLHEAARDITALGSTAILTLITIAAATYLLLVRKAAEATILVLSIGSGALLSTVLKLIFARARPDLLPSTLLLGTSSFPSGHAANSTMVYLTLGALLARVQTRDSARFYFMALAIALSLLIGLSRLYLGVHWPSDILAGWALGAAWAMLWWLIVALFQKTGPKYKA
jgi:undecaprenyl-diphosphatase